MEPGGTAPGASASASASANASGQGRTATLINYFCHKCCRPFHLDPEDFFCPYCFGRFIERMESVDEGFLPPNLRGQSTSAQPTPDARGPPAPEARGPAENAQAERQPQSPGMGNITNLAFLMAGNRIRGIHGTINLNVNDPLFEQLVLLPNPDNGNPIYMLNSDQVHAITEETFDAMVSLIWQGHPEGAPPLANEAINNIPDAPITEEQVNSSLQCAVCWEQFILEEKVKKLPCAHLYHEGCITPWLKMHATCPICRQNLAPPNENASAQPRDNNTENNDVNSLNNTLPVLAAMLVQRFTGMNRPPEQQQQPSQPQAAGEQPMMPPSAPPAPAPQMETQREDPPPPVPPRPLGSFTRDPVAGIVTLIRSLTGPSQPPPQPQQPPPQPPPPSQYYDMDLDFE